MPQYNPHTHVKIWLSNSPDHFMNFENQKRLIEMRATNPQDVIHLVYDSFLLNTHAIAELNAYCMEYGIDPLDANAFKELPLSLNEQRLYAFYKDEIEHLDAGGNLAVASDILRWISPVYSRGTYTDLDVPVNTSKLPSHITVSSALLLNIGSFNFFGKEMILANNDYVAIVDPAAAKDDIERVQTGMIDKLTHYRTNFIEETKKALHNNNFFNAYLLSHFENRLECIYIQKSATLKNSESSSRSLRAYIKQITTDKSLFFDFQRLLPTDKTQVIIARLRHNIKQQLTVSKWLFFRNEYKSTAVMLAQNDEHFIDLLMKKELSLYLKSIVICTTGPIEVANALFGSYVLHTKEFAKRVQPYSFKDYALQHAFLTQNSIALHENLIGMLRFLGAPDGELNDLSWLEAGEKLQITRQIALKAHRQALETQLPHHLLALKLKIQDHVHQLSTDLNGVFGFFMRSRKEAKITTLCALLECFDHNTNTFDTSMFKKCRIQTHSKLDSVLTSMFTNTTQGFIQTLNRLSHEALIYRLTIDHKISLIVSAQGTF